MKNFKKEFNLCNLFIVLWVAYTLQSFFLSNSIISLALFLPQLFIVFFCFYKLSKSNIKNDAMRAWIVVFTFLLVYAIIRIFSGNIVAKGAAYTVRSTQFLTMVISSMGSLIAFYYFSKKGLLREKNFVIYLIIFILCSIFDYYDYQAKALARLGEFSSFEEITNSVSYSFVALIPFVFFIKRTTFQYAILFLLVGFTVIGMKRGAILIAFIMILWFVHRTTIGAKKNRQLIVLLFAIAVMIIGGHYILQFYNNSDYFQYRIESTLEGNTSERDTIYSKLWDYWFSQNNIFKFLFGGGAFHTYEVVGNDAHNDWLELLVDCGLMGALIYLIYWIKLIRLWIRKKNDFATYSILGSCVFFTFLRSIYSMSLTSMPFPICLLMGFCFAQSQLNNQSNKIKQ